MTLDLFATPLPAGSLVCGVDEAGRGPLAGPVVVAAVILTLVGGGWYLYRNITSRIDPPASVEASQPQVQAPSLVRHGRSVPRQKPARYADQARNRRP